VRDNVPGEVDPATADENEARIAGQMKADGDESQWGVPCLSNYILGYD
jgi:hypothetical protein